MTNTDEPSLHVTFSTSVRWWHTVCGRVDNDAFVTCWFNLSLLIRYQAHTYFDLVNRAVGKANLGLMNLLEKQSGTIHQDLPLNLLNRVNVGRPTMAWKQLSSMLKSCSLPSELLQYLSKPGILGAAIDAYAADYLRNSLPPPTLSVNGTNGSSDLFRLKFRRSAWLCEDDGMIVLNTNVANGQSLKSDASPSFEVLPHCLDCATKLIESGLSGCAVSTLLGSANADEVQDIKDLIDVLEEYGVIERV